MSSNKPALRAEDMPDIEWLAEEGEWEEKGISYKALTEFGVGVRAEKPHVVAFPFYENGQIVGYQYRDLLSERKLGKREIWTDGRVNLFGLNMLRGADELYITEGLTDALTIYDATRRDKNRPDVLGLPGASTYKYLQSNYSVLRKYKRIYLVPDNDKAGQELVKQVMALPGMSPYKTHIVYLSDHKDVTEYRVNGDMFYFWEAARNSKPYAESPFLYNTKQLEDLKELNEASVPFRTGVDGLDYGLGGGIRREEFLGIVGFSGFGKSTFSLFLASEVVRLNPEAKVLVVGTEMSYKQNLRALAQMVTRTSWRGKPITSVQRQGAFTSVLQSEQLYLYRKNADVKELFDDIELAIVEHGINFVLIDVVTDLFPVGDLKSSGEVAKRLHSLTLGNDKEGIPPAAVVGVFHTSGVNAKAELSTNKIRGGNSIGNQMTSAIAVTGVTNSPRVPKETKREVVWLKKSREYAPDDVKDFYIEWNSDNMTYSQVEDEDNAKGQDNDTPRTEVPKPSRSESAASVSSLAVRAGDNDVTDESSTETVTPSGGEVRSPGLREAEAVEVNVEDVQQVHAGLSDTGDSNDSGVQGVANASEPSKVPRRIPDLRAVMEGRRKAESEGVGTGRDGTQPLGEKWVNVDTQQISKASGNPLTARRVHPANPQEYIDWGYLPPHPAPDDRANHARMARGESSTVPGTRKRRRAKLEEA